MLTLKKDLTKNEAQLIGQIVKRATALDNNIDSFELFMDLEAVHCNDYDMCFEEMLNAGLYNFLHDIKGIQHNIDRETGTLKNCFVPRYAT